MFTPIFKEVAQFKQPTVPSYAKVDFCILFRLWIILRSETCLSSFLTSCKIIVEWLSESSQPNTNNFRNYVLTAFLSCLFHMCYFISAAEPWTEIIFHKMKIHNCYSVIQFGQMMLVKSEVWKRNAYYH